MTTEIKRYTGQVKWFNTKSGYGFINDLESNKDVFVHHSGLKIKNTNIYKILYQGEYVEYDIDTISKDSSETKQVAINVSGIQGGSLMCEVRNLETKTRKK